MTPHSIISVQWIFKYMYMLASSEYFLSEINKAGEISVYAILWYIYIDLTHFNKKQSPGKEVSIISSPRGMVS